MIGKLSGRLDSIVGSHVMIDVNGVGYVVSCSVRTIRQLGRQGDSVSLKIETQVREDAISLFGFSDSIEQDWFRLLTTVQGVGAKVALALLSSLSPEQLAQTIAAQDKNGLTQADGVGPKLALRLVTELKDKVASFMGPASHLLETNTSPTAILPRSVAGDALSALVNLGYRRSDAFAAVSTLSQRNPEAKLDEIIRLSLAELSRKDSAA